MNFMIRTHKRIDFDLIPSVSHVICGNSHVTILPITQNEIWFTGKRLRTKEDLNLEMHRNELKVLLLW